MGSSSSVALPTRRGAGRVGKKGKGTGRVGGRGRSRRTVEPSSPPPPAHSPVHRTTMVEPFAEEAIGTPVQEPRVDGHSSHENLVQDQPRVEVHSAHETTVPEASPDVERPGWDTWGWAHPRGVRKPNSVLGVLCRTNFPGFVTLPGEGQVPTLGFSWEHYQAAEPLEEIIDGVLCHTRAEMVIKSFWTFYRCEDGHEEEASKAHHNKTEMPHLYDLYGMAHTALYKKAKEFCESDLDDPNNFTNISSHHKLVKYRDTGKATKGDDFNPSQEPLDPELVMISGGGRPHGSIAIGDGIIRCPLTLPEIKARQSSSCPEITHRPRPVDLAIEAVLQKERAANKAALEKERLASQAALDGRDQTTA
ncbi:hypothetical protein ZWY2020_040940 [Hordeum vulgare]|nr:hypothetical protein ZWY2020_040940 [Hordeum vulgare]